MKSFTLPATVLFIATTLIQPINAQDMNPKITTFLMFEGQAEEAITFYTSLFDDSEIVSITKYGPDGPGGQEAEDTVLNAVFTLKGQRYMAYDSYIEHGFTFTPSISLFVECDSEEELETLYEKLSESGEVAMPLDNYGFSTKYAWVQDGGVEPRVGGKVEFKFKHKDLSGIDEPVPRKYKYMQDGTYFGGSVTAWNPPRLLSYTWGEGTGEESEVTYELIPKKNNKVLLTLTHVRLGDDPAVLISVGAGWHTHLGILTDRLEGKEPEGFWTVHTKMEKEYERLIKIGFKFKATHNPL